MSNFKKYINSFSTQLGWLMGLLYYFSYAGLSASWLDPYLISVGVFISFFAPYYSKFSNHIDEKCAFYTASVFVGRLTRFLAQYFFNIIIFSVLLDGHSVTHASLSAIGGVWGVSLMISLTSQGIQYVALALYNRGIGNKNVNITLSVALSILIGALAAHGLPTAQLTLEICGIIFGLIGLIYSLYTDLYGLFAPKGGIGLFFGTFNPAHKTHAKMIKKFIQERRLEKVIVHPTLIPKVHRIALERGQIRIKERVNGMRVYETTEKADVHVNYFMTGKKFYETEHRFKMLNAMIDDEKLNNIVEVWNLEDAYNKSSFYGVISAIKNKFPGRHIHGMHGSDVGGMLVRAIYDESFGIIPFAVRRTDSVSATAIRSGAKGMTTNAVSKIMSELNFGLKN